MKADKKDPKKQKPATTPGKNQQPEHKPHAPVSQGHQNGEEGETTGSKEPTLRGATTDSSRTPKNPHDDMPTGGNIR